MAQLPTTLPGIGAGQLATDDGRVAATASRWHLRFAFRRPVPGGPVVSYDVRLVLSDVEPTAAGALFGVLWFAFRGDLELPDGTVRPYVFEACAPEGTIGGPGAWRFAVGVVPEDLQQRLALPR